MLLALMTLLNAGDQYRCLYVNVEPAQTNRENVAAGMHTILHEMASSQEIYSDDSFLKDHLPEIKAHTPAESLLREALTAWASASKKPVILLIDEIDALIGDTLISVLRQLRTGYTMRPKHFPQSVILCGVRDLHDYRIHSSHSAEPITGGGAFNIKAASLRMGNFGQTETKTLLNLHTLETGQVFEAEAVEAIWDNTQGQPWLVNAIAHELTFTMKANRDPGIRLTKALVEQAREAIILRRETHIDQLTHKLKEPRVHNIIAPILAGETQATQFDEEAIDYVFDLGLIVKKPELAIANPIYREVIPRAISWPIQASLTQKPQRFIDRKSGRLRMDILMQAFQECFREHSEHWTQRFQYKEAGAQLLLQAYLQRIINGGGRIDREYGLGRGRTDLLIHFPNQDGIQKIVLELKLVRGTRQASIEKALPQLDRYMDTCASSEGHLVLFDQTNKPWEKKIFQKTTNYKNKNIHIWGMSAMEFYCGSNLTKALTTWQNHHLVQECLGSYPIQQYGFPSPQSDDCYRRLAAV